MSDECSRTASAGWQNGMKHLFLCSNFNEQLTIFSIQLSIRTKLTSSIAQILYLFKNKFL